MDCPKLHITEHKLLSDTTPPSPCKQNFKDSNNSLSLCSSFDKTCTGSYRFGFNGMENDNEIKGNGNSLDFGARIYDPRLGRWLSVDPLFAKYPSHSPYNFAINNPVFYIDRDGRDKEVYYTLLTDNGTVKFKVTYHNNQVMTDRISYYDGPSKKQYFNVRQDITLDLRSGIPENEKKTHYGNLKHGKMLTKAEGKKQQAAYNSENQKINYTRKKNGIVFYMTGGFGQETAISDNIDGYEDITVLFSILFGAGQKNLSLVKKYMKTGNETGELALKMIDEMQKVANQQVDFVTTVASVKEAIDEATEVNNIKSAWCEDCEQFMPKEHFDTLFPKGYFEKLVKDQYGTNNNGGNSSNKSSGSDKK